MAMEIFVPVGADYEGICRLCSSAQVPGIRGPTVIEEHVALSRCSLLQAGIFICHQDQTRIEEIAEQRPSLVASAPERQHGARATSTRNCSNRIALRTFPGHRSGELTMADDLKNRGAQDRARVNVNEDHEVRYWTQKWGVSKEQLAAAVKKVGVSADAVARELGKA
jgi:hypothetical protein